MKGQRWKSFKRVHLHLVLFDCFYLVCWLFDFIFLLEVHSIIGHIVNSMVAHISLPAILERIMHSPGYSDCNFGQIKHLLKGKISISIGAILANLRLTCIRASAPTKE